MQIKCNSVVALLINLFMSFGVSHALPEDARAKGFVYLHEVDPSIKISPRYYGNENFVGKRIDGYEKPVIILTRAAAEALKKVQEEVKRNGYSLVAYDGYRPQRAVNHFMRWSAAIHDQTQKSRYYPRVNKADVFALGYVTKRSGHSRGSTIDLTLIEDTKELMGPQEQSSTLLDGFTITVLDDGTLDMGSSFDLFDPASHIDNNLIDDHYKARRSYLKSVMEKHGFKGYANEWWHFTLKNEPFPADQDSSYFDFPVS